MLYNPLLLLLPLGKCKGDCCCKSTFPGC